MKAYKVPTKTTITVDCEKMLEDLRAGPLYLNKSDYDSYKNLNTHTRSKGMQERPACKTIVVLERGVETQYIKLTLNTGPIRLNTPKESAMVVRNTETGEHGTLFRMLSTREYNRVRAVMRYGKTLEKATNGLFTTEGVVEK